MFVGREVMFVSNEDIFVGREVMFISNNVIFIGLEVRFIGQDVMFADGQVRFVRHQVRLVADEGRFPCLAKTAASLQPPVRPLKVPGRVAPAFLTAHFRLLPAPGKT